MEVLSEVITATPEPNDLALATNVPQLEEVTAAFISQPLYKVRLSDFEGPLDLLLFFIKRDELDI